MQYDAYGLTLSAANAGACAAFLAGVDQSMRLDAPGITELRTAIDLDENFALAHALLGRQLQIHGFRADVTQHIDRAAALKPSASVREQGAIDVIIAAARFQPNALQMATRHVEQYPLDAVVLAHLVGPFGLLAFSGQPDWREENVALLQQIKQHYPADDWWFLSTQSFMLAEVGDLDTARALGERAWQLSENGNCAHSLAHVHFETNAIDEGVAFIEEWGAAHGRSDMHHHLIWHLALLRRENGATPTALLNLYKQELDPRVSDPMPLSTFSDNAALLWRCFIAGLEIPTSIGEDLREYADKHYPHCGFSFADIHRVMAIAIGNDDGECRKLIVELSQLASEDGPQVAHSMLLFAEGFFAFARQDYAAAVKILGPVVADSVLLGGSNPQRLIIAETYSQATTLSSRQ